MDRVTSGIACPVAAFFAEYDVLPGATVEDARSLREKLLQNENVRCYIAQPRSNFVVLAATAAVRAAAVSTCAMSFSLSVVVAIVVVVLLRTMVKVWAATSIIGMYLQCSTRLHLRSSYFLVLSQAFTT